MFHAEAESDTSAVKPYLDRSLARLDVLSTVKYSWGGDPVETWLKMAQCAVLVVAPSSFSRIASVQRFGKALTMSVSRDVVFELGCSINLDEVSGTKGLGNVYFEGKDNPNDCEHWYPQLQ